MAEQSPIYVIFTMTCMARAARTVGEAPETWSISARAIEGYTYRLLRAGYPATLFLAPECAVEHAPLLGELAGQGAELGLYVNPTQLYDTKFKQHLGQYDAEDQRAMIEYAINQFYDALGTRPRSFRPGRYSASDATFQVLYDLGFRQGSVSEPGSSFPRMAIDWVGAYPHPHYVNPQNRLHPGDLPFLEVPLTTNPERQHLNRLPVQLSIEFGSVDDLHRPLLQESLERLERDQPPFRAICIAAHNRVDYYSDAEKHSRTVDELLEHLELLAEQYTIVPVTLASAHAKYRELQGVLKYA